MKNERESKNRKWYYIITENFVMKLVALIFTLILYFIVKHDVIKEISINIPVAITGLPAEKIFVGNLPPEGITVRVKGPWSKLIKLFEAKNRHFDIDLRNYKDGDVYRFMPFEIEKHFNIKGISVSNIDPPEIKVKYDTLVTKFVEVSPTIVGKVDSAHEIVMDKIKVTPEKVKVTGPSRVLAKLKKVKTVPINVNNADKSISLFIQLDMPEIPYVKFIEKRVRVDIPIRERSIEKKFENLKIRIKNCDEHFYICTVFPETYEALVVGKVSKLKKISKSAIENSIFIDKNTLPKDTGKFYNVKPTIVFSGELKDLIISIKPSKFNVEIDKKVSEEKTDINEQPQE